MRLLPPPYPAEIWTALSKDLQVCSACPLAWFWSHQPSTSPLQNDSTIQCVLYTHMSAQNWMWNALLLCYHNIKKKKLVLCDQCVGRSTQLKKNDCTEDVKLRLNHYHNCPFTVTITCLYINFYCNRSWWCVVIMLSHQEISTNFCNISMTYQLVLILSDMSVWNCRLNRQLYVYSNYWCLVIDAILKEEIKNALMLY